MKWYKRDPDAALSGMAELSFEECGAYNRLLDLLYSRDGNVPDDDVFCARCFHCNPRTWRKLKLALIAAGKVRSLEGKLTANRVEYTLNEARTFAERQANRARKRLEKTENNKENNVVGLRPRNAITTTTTTTTREEKEVSVSAANAARRRKARTSFPEGWKPTDLLPADFAEFDRFHDHALANGRLCADWAAAWRNWKTSPYRKPARDEGKNENSLLAALDKQLEQFGGMEAARAYERSISLDNGMLPASRKRISQG